MAAACTSLIWELYPPSTGLAREKMSLGHFSGSDGPAPSADSGLRTQVTGMYLPLRLGGIPAHLVVRATVVRWFKGAQGKHSVAEAGQSVPWSPGH